MSQTRLLLPLFGVFAIACTPPSHVGPSASHESASTEAPRTTSQPAPSVTPSTSHGAAMSAAPGISSVPAAPSSAPTPTPPASSASVEQPSAPVVSEPKLVDDAGKLLPQTKDKPSADSVLYKHHVQLLFDAIKQDKPEIARPFFFPLVAYEQVKGIAKPARDWKHRLWGHFERDIHEYHRKLGKNPEAAVLERIDFRGRNMRWMKPQSEGNRIGYYRLTHTRIVGKRADGRDIRLELTAMISWRGEWYVVHVNGFK